MEKDEFKNSDKENVLNLKIGSEQAFTHLFNKYSNKIYSVSRKLQLSHAEAEEVVQSTFLKIWRNRINLDENLSFNSYILTIAKSIIIKSSRTQAYHLAYEKYKLHASMSYDNKTEDYIIFSDLESFSLECLDKLPKQQRQIFMMKTQDHFSIEEISEELDISKRTAENHFYRACRKLKSELTKHNVIETSRVINFSPLLISLLY